mgnify:CR=1 FL=1
MNLPNPRYFIPAVALMTFLVASLAASLARGEEAWTDTQIVEAIGRAENSKRYPYGIKSINTKGDIAYARKICLNSVHNGRKRWERAGRPCDFIEFISRRYCPINAPDDNGTNRFWARNVKYFLAKGAK